MKKNLYIRILILSTCLYLTACVPQAGAIPTVEEVVAARNNISVHDAEVYCQENGGKIETWKDGKRFCIFKGFGCDPIEFYRGICGGFND